MQTAQVEVCTSVSTGRPGTNRDGMSRCPFVPGQRNFLVPVSLCPGTRAGAKIPGQTLLSRDVTFPKKQKKEKRRSKTGKGRSKTKKDVLKQEKDILKQERKF